jgi:hypothetical protein
LRREQQVTIGYAKAVGARTGTSVIPQSFEKRYLIIAVSPELRPSFLPHPSRISSQYGP